MVVEVKPLVMTRMHIWHSIPRLLKYVIRLDASSRVQLSLLLDLIILQLSFLVLRLLVHILLCQVMIATTIIMICL